MMYYRVSGRGGSRARLSGAILMGDIPHGFFMNWYGNQQGEGFEFHLLALGIAITLLIIGGGTWSLDSALVGAQSSGTIRSLS